MQTTILTLCRQTTRFMPGKLPVTAFLIWLVLLLTLAPSLILRMAYAEKRDSAARSMETVSDSRSRDSRSGAAGFTTIDNDINDVAVRDLLLLLGKDEHNSNGDDVIVRIER